MKKNDRNKNDASVKKAVKRPGWMPEALVKAEKAEASARPQRAKQGNAKPAAKRESPRKATS